MRSLTDPPSRLKGPFCSQKRNTGRISNFLFFAGIAFSTDFNGMIVVQSSVAPVMHCPFFVAMHAFFVKVKPDQNRH